MKYKLILIISTVFISTAMYAQQAERRIAFDNYKKYYVDAKDEVSSDKESSMLSFRKYFFDYGFRRGKTSSKWKDYIDLLQDDGAFIDLDDNDAGKPMGDNAANSAGIITDALSRILCISDAFRIGE